MTIVLADPATAERVLQDAGLMRLLRLGAARA
jgi:hypothetical protein